MRHPRSSLTHHPGISSNITNATHFSMSPMPPTLTHRSFYPSLHNHPCWHVTLARLLRNPRQYVNHIGTSLTPARHQSKHTIHASTPPTHARHPRHPRQHKQHAISRNPGYPIKLLKHLVFFCTAFTFRPFTAFSQKSGKLPQF